MPVGESGSNPDTTATLIQTRINNRDALMMELVVMLVSKASAERRIGSSPIEGTKFEIMNRLIYYDELNDEAHLFLSDATESTVKAIPEIEWHAIKNVLQNFGYTVLEIEECEN